MTENVADLTSLVRLVESMVEDGNLLKSSDGLWQVNKTTPSHDFNRQVVPAGENEEYPDGALMIFSDWNFWCVATLPSEYAAMDCRSLVGALWPDIIDPEILPDEGDYWWVAKCDASLEVPGEPFELWHLINYGKGHETLERFNTYPSLEELSAAEKKSCWNMTEGCVCRYQVKTWKDGVRVDDEPLPVSNIVYSPSRPPSDYPLRPATA